MNRRVSLLFISRLFQDTDTDDTDNGSDDDDAEDQALPNLAAELEAAVAALPDSHSTSPPARDSPGLNRKHTICSFCVSKT